MWLLEKSKACTEMELCKRRMGREESYSKSCTAGIFVAPSIESSRVCRLQTQPNLDVQTGGFAAGGCVKLQAKRGEIMSEVVLWKSSMYQIHQNRTELSLMSICYIYL